MNIVTLPVQLRANAGGRDQLSINLFGAHEPQRTLRLLVGLLEEDAPGIKSRLLDTEGKLRRFINIYVDNQDCRTLIDQQYRRGLDLDSSCEPPEESEIPVLDPLDLVLTGYEEIAIIPAAAGG